MLALCHKICFPVKPIAKLTIPIVEQGHRFIKRRVGPGLGFFSFETAWNTLQGYEVMNMVRKGDILGQVAFITH
jgi:transposase-like protein